MGFAARGPFLAKRAYNPWCWWTRTCDGNGMGPGGGFNGNGNGNGNGGGYWDTTTSNKATTTSKKTTSSVPAPAQPTTPKTTPAQVTPAPAPATTPQTPSDNPGTPTQQPSTSANTNPTPTSPRGAGAGAVVTGGAAGNTGGTAPSPAGTGGVGESAAGSTPSPAAGSGSEPSNLTPEDPAYLSTASQGLPVAAQSYAPSASASSSSPRAPTQTGIAGGGSTSTSPGASGGGSSSNGASGGVPPTTIAGIVVGIFLLFMILSLLFKFRRTAVVQRMISPFSRLKGGLPYNRNADSPSGTIDQTLLAAGAAADAQRNTPSPANLGPMVPQQAVLQAMAAGAAAQPKQQTQSGAGVNPARPPMREARRVPPPLLVPPVISKPNPTARSNNRNPPTPSPTSPAFTPSPLSSHPPNSPGGGSSSYAHYAGAPPNDDPNVKEGKDVGRSSSMRSSLGSMASSSAVLSPTLMSWPMPPATKGSKTPSPTPVPAGNAAAQSRQATQGQQLSPEQQWVNFQQPGQAVIRINQGQKRGDERRLA